MGVPASGLPVSGHRDRLPVTGVRGQTSSLTYPKHLRMVEIGVEAGFNCGGADEPEKERQKVRKGELGEEAQRSGAHYGLRAVGYVQLAKDSAGV